MCYVGVLIRLTKEQALPHLEQLKKTQISTGSQEKRQRFEGFVASFAV